MEQVQRPGGTPIMRPYALTFPLALLIVGTNLLQAQRPVGATVSPGAVGPAAPVATPIGGLVTRPLTSAPLGEGAAPPVIRRKHGSILRSYVADAPLARGGVVVTQHNVAAPVSRPVWIPTAEKPRWVIDSTLKKVQAYRDLIVTDVVCNYGGICVDRQVRIKARWVARCGCYAFLDGWGRAWRVE